jgi:hypothetical protein
MTQLFTDQPFRTFNFWDQTWEYKIVTNLNVLWFKTISRASQLSTGQTFCTFNFYEKTQKHKVITNLDVYGLKLYEELCNFLPTKHFVH